MYILGYRERDATRGGGRIRRQQTTRMRPCANHIRRLRLSTRILFLLGHALAIGAFAVRCWCTVHGRVRVTGRVFCGPLRDGVADDSDG